MYAQQLHIYCVYSKLLPLLQNATRIYSNKLWSNKRKKAFFVNLTQNQCTRYAVYMCAWVCVYGFGLKCYSVKQWDETMHTLIKFGNVSSSDTQHTSSKCNLKFAHTCNYASICFTHSRSHSTQSHHFNGILYWLLAGLSAHELSGKFTIKIYVNLVQ